MIDDRRTQPETAIRHLIRSVAVGSLATVMRDGEGGPYASLVSVATDHDGAPVMLLSDLADHTKNLMRDDRVSLLLNGSQGFTDPLAGERVTLQGRLQRRDDAGLRRRYLARHPQAADYVDFTDFGFYRLTLDRAHLVAGFGRIHWVPGEALMVAPTAELVACEVDVLTHMNQDHRDAIQLYANVLLGRDGDGWTMTGVDVEGADLRRAGEVARVTFDRPVTNGTDVRRELRNLVNRARTT